MLRPGNPAQDLYGGLGRSSSEAPPALDFSERMEAASRLAGMLQDAGVRWGLAGEQEGRGRRLDARPGGGAAQQAVYARMAGRTLPTAQYGVFQVPCTCCALL